MGRTRTLAAFLLVGAQLLHAAPSMRNEVVSLPGYGKPPTRHFSGFIEVDEQTSSTLFYYLVESQSSSATAPLLWWFNGGPGASSLVGLLAENGPLLLTSPTELIANPYSWNRLANVLYVEFGEGVGFSFCANSSLAVGAAGCKQADSDCSPCASSDGLVAAHLTRFFERFVGEAFPEMKGRDLYLAGESYAGVYIPTLARSLLGSSQPPPLKGLWVTDPCTDNAAQGGWLDIGVHFAYQKGLIHSDVWKTLSSDPSCSKGRTAVGDYVRDETSSACRHAWRLYDIATNGLGNAVHPAGIPGLPIYTDPLNAYGPSGGPDPEAYLGRADVRAAIHASASPNKVYHVELGNNGYSTYENQYAACNNHAQPGAQSMLDVYRELVKQPSLKTIIVVSGDIDPVVAMHGTETAVHAIGFKVRPGNDRRPWFYNNTRAPAETILKKPIAWGQSLRAVDGGVQVGGFVTTFDTQTATALHFVTIRDSGHMVPAYAPQRALHTVQKLLMDGSDLSPTLPDGWDTVGDDGFYARSGPNPGLFANWTIEAMSAKYSALN